jgi:predicted RNase H-related nuclease YkuK (DUF458 family)
MKVLIGIDPDVDKSGVAFKLNDEIILMNLKFFRLFDRLKELIELRGNENIVVYVECGYLNASNWHKKVNQSASINAKIGELTGANFETAKKICEMLEYLQITHHKIKPTKSKVNAKLFAQITGIVKTTNQEQRDAYMLIHGRI